MPAFDVAAIRAQFPALRRQQDGMPVVFLDGPGGTQVPDRVIDAVAGYYRTMNANHGGAFVTSRASDAMAEAAHTAVADFLGAATADEVKFGANMTSLTFHVSRSIAATLAEGDEIVVTTLDHEANVSPWRAVAADRGLVVRTVDIHPEDGTLDLASLDAALGPRTRLVAFGYASNALGTINPVRDIVRRAHAVGALTYVDAVHYAPHGSHRRPGARRRTSWSARSTSGSGRISGRSTGRARSWIDFPPIRSGPLTTGSRRGRHRSRRTRGRWRPSTTCATWAGRTAARLTARDPATLAASWWQRCTRLPATSEGSPSGCSTAFARSPGYASGGSRTPPGWTSGRPPSRSRSPGSRPRRLPRSSAGRASSRGTATSTPGRSSSGWEPTSEAACSGWVSSTTRPQPRSTGPSRHYPASPPGTPTVSRAAAG